MSARKSWPIRKAIRWRALPLWSDGCGRLDKFKYVQFSDHNIAPVKAEHFHIFFGGTSQEALFEEMDNWPTYYPDNLSGQEIAQEMLAHWCKRKSQHLRDFLLETIRLLGIIVPQLCCSQCDKEVIFYWLILTSWRMQKLRLYKL